METRICKICKKELTLNKFEFSYKDKENPKRWRKHICKKCRSHKRTIYITKKGKRFKLKAIKYLGNKCSICGYSKCVAALEFHHKIGRKKDHMQNIFRTHSWGKVLKELKKCGLFCANCHREIHYQLVPVE